MENPISPLNVGRKRRRCWDSTHLSKRARHSLSEIGSKFRSKPQPDAAFTVPAMPASENKSDNARPKRRRRKASAAANRDDTPMPKRTFKPTCREGIPKRGGARARTGAAATCSMLDLSAVRDADDAPVGTRTRRRVRARRTLEESNESSSTLNDSVTMLYGSLKSPRQLARSASMKLRRVPSSASGLVSNASGLVSNSLRKGKAIYEEMKTGISKTNVSATSGVEQTTAGALFGRPLREVMNAQQDWAAMQVAVANSIEKSSTDDVSSDAEEDTLQAKRILGLSVPYMVFRCAQLVQEKHLKCEGIFRISAAHTTIQEKRQEIDSSTDCGVAALCDDDMDPYVLCCMLKMYLRELPEPILTSELQDSWMDIARVVAENGADVWTDSMECEEGAPSTDAEEGASDPDPTAVIEAVKELIGQLPRYNRNLLQCVSFVMRQAACNHEHNKMTAANLAIVIGPNLFPDASLMFEEAKSLAMVFLCHYDRVFGV